MLKQRVGGLLAAGAWQAAALVTVASPGSVEDTVRSAHFAMPMLALAAGLSLAVILQPKAPRMTAMVWPAAPGLTVAALMLLIWELGFAVT